MGKKALELYVHIPFCERKCNYCDFLSMSFSEEIKIKYIDALLNEIDTMKFLAGDYEVTSVFFGGGTPSILHADEIYRLLNALRRKFTFHENVEISLETNPGTLDEDKLNIYKEAGFNRLSLGLQSTDDLLLKELGRIHDFSSFKENYYAAKKAGFQNINVDLMFSLPYQTLSKWKESLHILADEFKPQHISAYSLIIEKGTPFYDIYEMDEIIKNKGGQPMILPSEEVERSMYYAAADILKKSGYNHYEISNYALEGFECRHNIGYWTGVSYLGLGLGASSYINGIRFKNSKDMESYLSRYIQEKIYKKDLLIPRQPESLCQVLEEKGKEDFQILTDEDKMSEFMFLGLRRIKGIQISEFENLFSKPIEQVYGPIIEKMIKLSLMKEEAGYLSLTNLGVDISNQVLSEFLLD